MIKNNKDQTFLFHSFFSILSSSSARLDYDWLSILPMFPTLYCGRGLLLDWWKSWRVPSNGMTFLFLFFSIFFEESFNRWSVRPLDSIIDKDKVDKYCHYLLDLNGKSFRASNHSLLALMTCLCCSDPSALNLILEA